MHWIKSFWRFRFGAQTYAPFNVFPFFLQALSIPKVTATICNHNCYHITFCRKTIIWYLIAKTYLQAQIRLPSKTFVFSRYHNGMSLIKNTKQKDRVNWQFVLFFPHTVPNQTERLLNIYWFGYFPLLFFSFTVAVITSNFCIFVNRQKVQKLKLKLSS